MRSVALAAAVVVSLAACSSDGTPAGGGKDETEVSIDPAIVADSNVPDPAEYATNGTIPEEPGFVQADANAATSDKLVAVLQTNGIPDAAAMAAQVIGHRPYTAVDQLGSEFDDLRVALAADGLDDVEVEAVIASLTLTR